MEMCPNYFNGPYGELRKWILELIEETRMQKNVKHQNQFAIPKEGAAQVVLVGPPNAGKSSLLKALTGRQVAVGDYPFTTLKPIAGMINLQGAVVQLVDLPGLLQGAIDGAGGGKSLLACVRSADAILYVIPATDQGVLDGLQVIREVREEAGIDLPCGVLMTKNDLEGAEILLALITEQVGNLPLVSCSTLNTAGHKEIHDLIWNLTGLMRVYPKRRGGERDSEPIVLRPGSTVESFILGIHKEWLSRFKQARVYGPSAKFPGMAVGIGHVLQDGDVVELLMTK
jgi:small GTP-binding protein